MNWGGYTYDPRPQKKDDIKNAVMNQTHQVEQVKFQTHNPFGIRREEIVGSVGDFTKVVSSAKNGSPYNFVEVALRLPQDIEVAQYNDHPLPLLCVDNGSVLHISKGSEIESVCVWKKNPNIDLPADLSISIGFDVPEASRQETKDYYRERVIAKNAPLTAAILEHRFRFKKSQKLSLEILKQEYAIFAAEWKDTNKKEMPAVNSECVDVDDCVGEAFNLVPIVNIISGKVKIGDLGFSISYSPNPMMQE